MHKRTIEKIRFEADGDEAPGAIQSFRLVQDTEHQTRRRESDRWHTDFSHPETKIAETLVGGISRQELSELVRDGVEWLSYPWNEER